MYVYAEYVQIWVCGILKMVTAVVVAAQQPHICGCLTLMMREMVEIENGSNCKSFFHRPKKQPPKCEQREKNRL